MSKEKAIIQTIHYSNVSRYSSNNKVRVCFMLAAMLFANSASIHAGPLNWLKAKVTRSDTTNSTDMVSLQQQPQTDTRYEVQEKSEEVMTGQNLDAYAYAQSHWSHSKKILSAMCKQIVRNCSDDKIIDITKKLFSIDIQGYKETVKTFALGMKGIQEQNNGLKQKLVFLNQIISAPQKETLEELEKSIASLWQTNSYQTKIVKKYMRGAEGLITLGSQSYETLELIPSMSEVSLDLFIQTSKRLMKQMQSNGEAFKGLLLNVQNANEQIASTLEMIRSTVKSSLRFSDHFAIQQFPLINLPTPSREKIFVHLKSLKNTIKGISNTLSIGNSQIKNSSQQFAHLIQGLTAKAGESFKYRRQSDGENQEINQISVYSRNQISGLFQRTKEIMRSTRMEMAKVMSEQNVNSAPPAIGIESRSDFMAKKSMSVSQKQLPLFLLGGKQQAKPNNSTDIAIADKRPALSVPKSSDDRNELASLLLYSEKTPVQDPSNDSLMSSEMNILQKELGNDFFFTETTNQSENVEPEYDNEFSQKDEKEIVIADNYDDDEPLMQVSYDNLSTPAEPEIELLKFDSIIDEDDSY